MEKLEHPRLSKEEAPDSGAVAPMSQRTATARTAITGRPFSYLALALLLALLSWGYLSTLLATAQEPWRGDYLNIYVAAHQLLEGENPYRQVSWEGGLAEIKRETAAASRSGVVSRPQSLLLPPVTLLLVAPFTQMPLNSSLPLFSAVSFLCLLLALLKLERSLGLLHEDWPFKPGGHRLLLAVVLCLLFFPTWLNLCLGQPYLLLLPIVVFLWTAVRGANEPGAGLLLGFLITQVPGLLLLLLFFLASGRLRLVLWSLTACLAIGLLPLLLFRSAIYLDYASALLAAAWFGAGWNASLLGMVSPIFGASANTPLIAAPWIAIAFCALCAAGLALLVWRLGRCLAQAERSAPHRERRHAALTDLGFSACFPLALLIQPVSWLHSFVLVIPAMMIGLQLLLRRRHPWRWRERLILVWLLAAAPYPLVTAEANDSALLWIGYPTFDSYALILMGLTLVGLFRRELRGEPKEDPLASGGSLSLSSAG